MKIRKCTLDINYKDREYTIVYNVIKSEQEEKCKVFNDAYIG